MNPQELQIKLNVLKQKWIGRTPSDNDPRYWEYRADRCLAIRIMNELKKMQNPTHGGRSEGAY